MSTRQIRIEGERMRPERIPVGTRGSYAMVNLSFSFDGEWNGLTKKIVFYPQRGEPVYRVYNAGDAVVPAEVMQYAGESPFVVSGYETDGEGTILRKVISCPGILIVEHTLSDVGHEPEIPSASAFEVIVEKLGAPYIGDNGNWFVWDAESNSFMDTGLPSRGIQGEVGRGLTILGHYDTLDALKASVTAPQDGDAYSVGTVIPYPVYIWDGALGEWVDHGNLRGVGIQKIEQISSSMDSLGANVIRVTLDDGSFYDYTVRNGDRGPAGSIWIGTSAPPDDSYSIWLNPSGVVSGFVGANQGTENAGRVLAVGEDGAVIPREETPYTLPEASPDALGGIKADAAETADTQPVRKGTDGKLYTAPGGDTSIGITGAFAGQIPKVKAVDESGAPTEWTAEADTTPFIVKIGGNDSSGYTSSHTFEEIVAAANAGRVVMGYTEYMYIPGVSASDLFGVYFNLYSTQDTAAFEYTDSQKMIRYGFYVSPVGISASAAYISAKSYDFGGVKADSAESSDTQPVRIGGDGKLYTAPGGGGGADISLGISGASAGQVAKVKTVDASGAPTEWEAGDAASGGREWIKLGDVTVNQTAEFVPLSFSNGIVTIDTNADGYASLPSSGTIGCIVHTIDVTSKANPVVGMLKPKNYEAGTFEFYDRDSVFQSSAAYDPTTYKISIGNVAMVVLENIPTDYKRYKSRVTTPAYTNHGLRARYTCDGFTEIGCGADTSVNMVGGAIIETEFYPHPYDENYVYRRVRTAYGKFYGGGSGNEFQSFELISSGSGKTKPQESGKISFKVSSMIFVNGTRFELWGTNND